MKNRLPTPSRLGWALGLLVASVACGHAAGAGIPELTARTNRIADVVVERKSVFDSRTPKARNPFYPDAVRVTAVSAEDAVDHRMTAFTKLNLRGIVSGRSAIINNRNFVPGDEATVRLDGGQTVKIKVVSVGEDHAKVVINGQGEAMTLYVRGANR